MTKERNDFFLEVRDSYFARLKQVDQELGKTRVRSYQALAAEILGFYTFIRIFSQFNLRNWQLKNCVIYNLLDVIVWILVAFVIVGFFYSFRLIYLIEKPKEWHTPAPTLDALAAVETPTNVTDLLRYYLPTLEQEVLADENALEKVKETYSKITKIFAAQIGSLGAIGSVFLIYWLFTRF